MTRNELYQTYNAERKKTRLASIRTVPLRTPEQQEERCKRASRLRQLRHITVHEGQGCFRLRVLGHFGGACCITGLLTDVEARHILPYCDTANQHPSNGIPLAKFLNSAFDTGLLSFEPDTLRIIVLFKSILARYFNRQTRLSAGCLRYCCGGNEWEWVSA
ncbi:TPA: HNH endonuclease [Serratia fonticola]